MLGAALALIRFAFVQHRTMADRFVNYLESSAGRHEQVLDRLTGAVEENTLLLQRVVERLP